MKLIIGLGNPGKKYEKTRHNVGFMMADKLQKDWNLPEFKFDKKSNAEVSEKIISPSLSGRGIKGEGADEGKFSPFVKCPLRQVEDEARGLRGVFKKGDKVLLAKPQSYMNNSGEVVKKIMKFYKIKPENIIVIHDDLDIDLGKYKISAGSSAAGHNGAQSVINALRTKKFTRVRIGIEGAQKRKARKIAGDAFVLKNFTPTENKTIQKISGEIMSSIQKISQR